MNAAGVAGRRRDGRIGGVVAEVAQQLGPRALAALAEPRGQRRQHAAGAVGHLVDDEPAVERVAPAAVARVREPRVEERVPMDVGPVAGDHRPVAALGEVERPARLGREVDGDAPALGRHADDGVGLREPVGLPAADVVAGGALDVQDGAAGRDRARGRRPAERVGRGRRHVAVAEGHEPGTVAQGGVRDAADVQREGLVGLVGRVTVHGDPDDRAQRALGDLPDCRSGPAHRTGRCPSRRRASR